MMRSPVCRSSSSCCDVQDPGNVGAIVRGGSVRRDRRRRRRRHRRSLRMEGAARVDGQRLSSARRGARAAARRGRAARASRHARARGGAARRTALPLSDLRAPAPCCSAAKAAGCPTALDAWQTNALTIPMRPPVESLNVAVAAALIAYEARGSAGRAMTVILFDDEARHPDTWTGRRRSPSGCGRARSTSSSARSARRPGPAAAPSDRAGPPAVDHPVGSAGHRQDHPGAADRRRHPRALHLVQRRALRHQGDPRGDDRGRRSAAAAGPPHHPLHRRDPPLQQGAAGRLPAPRRGRRHRPDRRDDGEPVVRGELGAAVAVEGLRAEGARTGRDRRRSCGARWPTRERGLGALGARGRRRRA